VRSRSSRSASGERGVSDLAGFPFAARNDVRFRPQECTAAGTVAMPDQEVGVALKFRCGNEDGRALRRRQREVTLSFFTAAVNLSRLAGGNSLADWDGIFPSARIPGARSFREIQLRASPPPVGAKPRPARASRCGLRALAAGFAGSAARPCQGDTWWLVPRDKPAAASVIRKCSCTGFLRSAGFFLPAPTLDEAGALPSVGGPAWACATALARQVVTCSSAGWRGPNRQPATPNSLTCLIPVCRRVRLPLRRDGGRRQPQAGLRRIHCIDVRAGPHCDGAYSCIFPYAALPRSACAR